MVIQQSNNNLTLKITRVNKKANNSNNERKQQQKHYKKYSSKAILAPKYPVQGKTQVSEADLQDDSQKTTIENPQAAIIFSESDAAELSKHKSSTNYFNPPECNLNREGILEDETVAKQSLHPREEHAGVQLPLHIEEFKKVRSIPCNPLRDLPSALIGLIEKQHIPDHSEFSRSVASITEHTIQLLKTLAKEIHDLCIREANKFLQFPDTLESSFKESTTNTATECSEKLPGIAKKFAQQIFKLIKTPKDLKKRKKLTNSLLRKLIPTYLDLIFNSYLGVIRKPLAIPHVPDMSIFINPKRPIDECFLMTDLLEIIQLYNNYKLPPQSEVITQSSPHKKSQGASSSHSGSDSSMSACSQDSSFNTIILSYD